MRFADAVLKSWSLVFTGFFRSLARRAIRHPRRAIFFVSLVALGFAPGMWRLKLRTDGHALVPESAPEVVRDRAIREHFGVEDQVVVLIRSGDSDGIYNPATVQLVRQLTQDFCRVPGVSPFQIVSLATEPSFRFRPGTFVNQRLLEPALTNKASLSQLRDDVRQMELYTGTLVSSNEQSTLILVGIPNGADRPQFYNRIRQIISARRSANNAISLTGAPVAESLLGTQILEDLGVPRAFLDVSVQGEAPAGFPSNLHELKLFVARRVGLVPMAAAVMMLVLLLCFRNLMAALLPLPGIAATILFVFGLMGWCGVPLYLTTAVMPVLLTVISATNDIYLFNRYFRLLHARPGADHLDLLEETFDKLARPVACTSLTGVIGFLSFGLSPLVPVRAFGVFTGIGALFGLFLSLTVVPALLALVNPRWLRPPNAAKNQRADLLGAWFARTGTFVVLRRRWVAGCAVAIMALTPLGLRKLVVQDSWISGFDPESEFRRVTQSVNRDFFGMHELLVSFDATRMLSGLLSGYETNSNFVILPQNTVEDPMLIKASSIRFSIPAQAAEGPRGHENPLVWNSRVRTAFCRSNGVFVFAIPRENFPPLRERLREGGEVHFDLVEQSQLRPEIVRAIADTSSFIRGKRQLAVGGVLGPSDYLATTSFILQNNDPKARRLPESPAETSVLWNDYAAASGEERMRQIVDTNFWQSLTTVFLKDANFVDTAKLMSDLRDYEREYLAPKGIKIEFAGDVAVSQALIHGIVVTQLQSLVWSLLGIFAVTAWLGRSWRWGFYCLLPSLLAVIVKFAVMGWTGIPLGVATSMFAAMTLGIGVNCAIHLLESHEQACAGEVSSDEALGRALRLTGPPALINTLAMSLGFGVLMLSQVPANARLGVLVILGLVNCFIASILILPVLLSSRNRGMRRRGEESNLDYRTKELAPPGTM